MVSDRGNSQEQGILPAQKVCPHCNFVDPINIQFIQRDEKHYFLEVNPRSSGGIACGGEAVAEAKPNLVEKLLMLLTG